VKQINPVIWGKYERRLIDRIKEYLKEAGAKDDWLQYLEENKKFLLAIFKAVMEIIFEILDKTEGEGIYVIDPQSGVFLYNLFTEITIPKEK